MENRKRYTAIVLAAGSGRRMQSDTPKQFMELCGHPLVYYSLYAFEKSPVDDIILVTGKDDVSYCRKEIVEACDFRKVRAVIPGGKERYLSVYEGLKAAAGTDYVLIHDGARPMIDVHACRRRGACMCDWCTGKRYDQSGKCKTLCCGYTGQKLSVGGTDTTELFL